MGFFGAFVFDGRSWTEWDLDSPNQPNVTQPWMSLIIHDSDVATVGYAPRGDGSGLAYLGTTPRSYFDDETASAPTDVAREAVALAQWRAGLRGKASRVPALAVSDIRPFLAADDDPEVSDNAELSDADILVEVKASQFLRALDLPLPSALVRDA